MEVFVYCWTDWKQEKLYVGSHKGSPDDGYVCSGKHMLKEYKERPDDFTRQIVASGTLDDMRAFELVLLKAEKVNTNEHYYNKNHHFAPPIMIGEDNPMSRPEVKKKHQEAIDQRDPDWQSGENHHFYGKFGKEAPNYKDGRCSDPKKYKRLYYREWREKHREEINRRKRESRKIKREMKLAEELC